MFLGSQTLRFVQLLEDAGARSAAGQAPPEDFTVGGIIWRTLMIGLLAAVCVLLGRHQSGTLRLGRTRLYLLSGLMLILWATIFFIDTTIEIFIYPEFILILDCLAVGVCVIAPIAMLVLADLNRLPPDDNILLFLGIGGIGFSIISILIIAVVLRASYTLWRLVPELLFRLGLTLFGVGTLQKALKLRASYPLVTPVRQQREEPPRKPRKRAREEKPFSLQLDGEDAYDDGRQYTSRTPRPQTNYDDGRQYTSRTPRPQTDYDDGRQYTSRTPRPQTGYDDGRQYTSRTPRPQTDQAMWQTGRIIVQGGTGRIPTQDPGSVPAERQTCPDCGKRMPLGFPNCPRCGRGM